MNRFHSNTLDPPGVCARGTSGPGATPGRAKTAGFTLMEAMMVTSLLAVAATVSMIQMHTTIAIVDADRACNIVASQLQYARQTAIDQRRNVRIDFIDDTEIKVTRIDNDEESTVLADVHLPSGFRFEKPGPLEVGDTPDAYGNTNPVDFNLGSHGTYGADGTFIDDSGVVLNGTIFTLGGPIGTARSVTLSGATGRLHTYWLDGFTWTERN